MRHTALPSALGDSPTWLHESRDPFRCSINTDRRWWMTDSHPNNHRSDILSTRVVPQIGMRHTALPSALGDSPTWLHESRDPFRCSINTDRRWWMTDSHPNNHRSDILSTRVVPHSPA